MARKPRVPTKGKTVPDKRKPRKPFRVFEAGAGAEPVGLFKRASLPRWKRASFIGVEKESVRRFWTDPLGKALREAGLKEIPRNVTFIDSADALEEIVKVPKGSQSLVFASYFLNNLPTEESRRFLVRAKQALRSGGRIAIVGDKMTLNLYRMIAEELGMGFHYIEISDKAAAKSDSQSIRKRATPKARMRKFKKYKPRRPDASSDPGMSMREMFRAIKEVGLMSHPAEMYKPTIFLLRKKRQGEK